MISCDLSLKELETLRKLCGEQENYFHRNYTQALANNMAERAMLMKNKSSTAKKLRFKLQEIVDSELEKIISLASTNNME